MSCFRNSMCFVAIKMSRLEENSGKAATRNAPSSVLTSFDMDLTLRIMGDKSPKNAHKHAAQKQVKANAANQKKSNATSAKQVPKPRSKRGTVRS